MPTKTVRLFTIALVLSDIFAILAAFTIAYILRVQLDARPLITSVSATDYIQIFVVLTPFWLLTFASLDLYNPKVYQKRLTEVGKLLVGAFLGILLVIGFAFVFDMRVFPARLVAVYAAFLVFVLLVLGREVLRQLRTAAFQYGRGIQRVLVIGSGSVAEDIVKNLKDTANSGYNIVAICGTGAAYGKAKKFTNLDNALGALKTMDIDTIIQTELFTDTAKNRQVYESAVTNHVGYSFIPGEVELYSGSNVVDVLNGYPIISVSQTPLFGWGEVVKRGFDVLVSLTLLVVLSPLLLLLVTAQKIVNPGKVLFKHERVTLRGKKFNVYKFRSMRRKKGFEDALASDEFRAMGREDLATEYEKNFKVENDPRVTPFGNFLRKTSLDELPQLFNILKGDLSLVGPRPMLATEIDAKYSKTSGASLLSVRSGLTGLWQVSGRSDITDEQRIQLELYYVQNWSFWLDIKILIKTVGVVLKRRGAQ
ncbi:sugar transferase [Candidatus Saccharibacteria bacterium]|nr:sugar transferase [Candidatus Saccharibacteria bacterium]